MCVFAFHDLLPDITLKQLYSSRTLLVIGRKTSSSLRPKICTYFVPQSFHCTSVSFPCSPQRRLRLERRPRIMATSTRCGLFHCCLSTSRIDQLSLFLQFRYEVRLPSPFVLPPLISSLAEPKPPAQSPEKQPKTSSSSKRTTPPLRITHVCLSTHVQVEWSFLHSRERIVRSAREPWRKAGLTLKLRWAR